MDSGGKRLESNNIKAIANTTYIIDLKSIWCLMPIIKQLKKYYIQTNSNQ